MDPRRSFGRRAPLQPTVSQAVAPAPVLEPDLRSHLSDAVSPSIEDEIAAWKEARGPVVPFPWRQLSLMAGLCFGIASFVLPATVNDTMQWPLYALTAASLYAGLRKRKAK
jgi:hypothetical protein